MQKTGGYDNHCKYDGTGWPEQMGVANALNGDADRVIVRARRGRRASYVGSSASRFFTTGRFLALLRVILTRARSGVACWMRVPLRYFLRNVPM